MTSEWDNTPWAGSAAQIVSNGLPDLRPASAQKAVYGGSYLNSLQSGPLLSSLQTTPQQRAAAYLRAYKVGWFYKAERKISTDIGMLRRTVSPEVEGDNEREVIEPDVRTPFDQLDPIGQFLRLMERPHPDARGGNNYTGRQLFSETQIRLDMAGTAFWYLEGADFGLPSAIYGISPARLWPEHGNDGALVGWTLDKNAPSGGVPFSLREILPFSYCGVEDGPFGQGVVEAVQANVPLSELMSRHTADVLHTGGRLAGMMWPREKSLGEDEFNDAIRAWRNVTSDPNAARRLLIFPEPMEYAQGASTPAEIGIPELANLDRDTVLSAFPMWPELLGIPMPAGLNASGESRRAIQNAYWEESIHPRVELLEDTIQVGLMSRYEAVVGGSWDFDIEEPNLDDAGSLIEKAGAFKALVSIGFDAKESVAAVGLDGIKWNGLPDLLDPAKQAEMAAQAAEAKPEGGLAVSVNDTSRQDRTETTQPIAKAAKGHEDVARDHVLSLADFLDGQRDRTIEAIKATYPAAKANRKGWATKADPEWWDTAAEDAALRAVVAELYIDAGRASLQVVADALDRSVTSTAVKRIIADLMAYGGERIADINARTLQAITIELAEGSRRGYSITQLIEGVAAENYKGVLEVGLENGVGVWGDARAEMIARTETALSYNRAAIQSYGSFGVQQVQAIDGDGDAECAERNGHIYSIDEALGLTDHPNGTLDWAPLVDKAVHEKAVPDIHLTVNIPDTLAIPAPIVEAPIVNLPAPVVNVEAPVVNVEAPVVTVPAPVVNVAPPDMTIMEAAVLKATSTVTDVRLVENVAPPRKRKVKRDQSGRITEIIEE